MLEWLAGWLKTVIAVVLLAGLVELLLPGKAMQRYARLVVGLLVLLTLLTPLLKVFGADPGRLLEDGLRRWEASRPSGMPDMPGLEQIKREADRLRIDREKQAAALAERQLAAAMAAEAEAATGRKTAGVDIRFADGRGAVLAVEIRLDGDAGGAGAKPGAAAGEGGSEAADGGAGPEGTDVSVGTVEPVEPVEQVDVGLIDPGAPGTGGDGGNAAAGSASLREAWTAAEPAEANAVRAAIAAKWGVRPDRVAVLVPAAVPAKAASGVPVAPGKSGASGALGQKGE